MKMMQMIVRFFLPAKAAMYCVLVSLGLEFLALLSAMIAVSGP